MTKDLKGVDLIENLTLGGHWSGNMPLPDRYNLPIWPDTVYLWTHRSV